MEKSGEVSYDQSGSIFKTSLRKISTNDNGNGHHTNNKILSYTMPNVSSLKKIDSPLFDKTNPNTQEFCQRLNGLEDEMYYVKNKLSKLEKKIIEVNDRNNDLMASLNHESTQDRMTAPYPGRPNTSAEKTRMKSSRNCSRTTGSFLFIE